MDEMKKALMKRRAKDNTLMDEEEMGRDLSSEQSEKIVVGPMKDDPVAMKKLEIRLQKAGDANKGVPEMMDDDAPDSSEMFEQQEKMVPEDMVKANLLAEGKADPTTLRDKVYLEMMKKKKLNQQQ